MKSVIGFTQVVELLHQHGAPEEVCKTLKKKSSRHFFQGKTARKFKIRTT